MYVFVHVCQLCMYVCVFLLPLQAAKEHYMMLKEDYQKQVEKLTDMVDGGVDTCDFLQVSGNDCCTVCVQVLSLTLFSCICCCCQFKMTLG